MGRAGKRKGQLKWAKTGRTEGASGGECICAGECKGQVEEGKPG